MILTMAPQPSPLLQLIGCFCVIFFFKQKTAYEIYQCDWSSDVCSSDVLTLLYHLLNNCLQSNISYSIVLSLMISEYLKGIHCRYFIWYHAQNLDGVLDSGGAL